MYLKTIIVIFALTIFLSGCSLLPTPADNIAGTDCNDYDNNKCPDGYTCYQSKYKKAGEHENNSCYKQCNVDNDCPDETPNCITTEKDKLCY